MIDTPWRFEIEHRTVFTYDEQVRSSYNEVRMIPLNMDRQVTMQYEISISPNVNQYQYVDYWGTQVVAFDVPKLHDKLEIISKSSVDTNWQSKGPSSGASWADVANVSEEMAEFLFHTKHTSCDDRLTEIARTLRRDTPFETVETILDWVDKAITYEPGSTSVHTCAAEVLAKGKGVCQDRTHVALALLRQIGVPSKYVSGYLHPHLEPGISETVLGQSHAWIESWVGCWTEFDPTNLGEVAQRHVMVAKGRDYYDVAPIKGIYGGNSNNTMETSVSVTRLR